MTRFTVPAAIFLLLVKDSSVLLIRRQNTGWCDGDYDLVAGHIEGNEHLTTAVAREAKEEVGITVDPADAQFVHLAHCLGNKEYFYMTFEVRSWEGEPTICEPDKCDDLQWFPLTNLPTSLTPGTKTVLDAYIAGESYSEIEA